MMCPDSLRSTDYVEPILFKSYDNCVVSRQNSLLITLSIPTIESVGLQKTRLCSNTRESEIFGDY